MTEYEIEDLRQSVIQSIMALSDVQATHISIYLTIIFAFSAVAYVAGSKLTRLQLIITCFVFTAASLWELMMITTLAQAAVSMGAELSNAGNSVKPPFSDAARLWFSRVIWSSGIFAALTFMWTVRNSKGGVTSNDRSP